MTLTLKRDRRGRIATGAAGLLLAATLALGTAPAASANPHGRVLRVGTFDGKKGPYSTISDAVAAAKSGDWILVAPGDYKERGDYGSPETEAGAGVNITTPGIHIRGLERNTVVVDGTKPGTPQCSTAPGDQDFGPSGHGRNGIRVSAVDDVTIENLTVCNFLTGDEGGGNEIWFNGGDGTGTIGMNGYRGTYLSATSTFFSPDNRGEYGLFVSNARGPGLLDHTYGSNMADAAYYIGACQDCNAVVNDAHAQFSALGYSGTNSGGHLIVQHSEFDNNKTGFSTNSQNNDDAPSPQSGHCPDGMTGPTGTDSCWVFQHNRVHDNNNPSVPASGSADLGPIGVGLVISGGRFDTVTDNQFWNNDSWAMLTVPFIDTGTPPPIAHCEGGVPNDPAMGICLYNAFGNEVSHNSFAHNGGYGNPTNGDLADISDPLPDEPGNCYHGNTDMGGAPSSAPPDIQSSMGSCGVLNQGGVPLNLADVINPDPNSLVSQVVCASGVFGPCMTLPPPAPPGTLVGTYPPLSTPVLPALTHQRSMPNPCAGVPNNPWCNGQRHHGDDDHQGEGRLPADDGR
jgi:hypothetical protein